MRVQAAISEPHSGSRDIMDILIIWARTPDSASFWVVDAWDADSAEDNQSGWEDTLEKHRAEHGASNISVTRSYVSRESVSESFGPTRIKMTPLVAETTPQT